MFEVIGRHDTSFDLAVIGAGPAGAAAALAAARAGLSVGLFEPQPVPDRPCGEGILPSGVSALRQLDLPGLLARGHALERIRYVLTSGRELAVDLPLAGCALERPVLTGALARALECERRITRIQERVSSRRTPGGFHLFTGGAYWTARLLIAADGLAGQGASWLRAPERGSVRYGLRARVEARSALEHVEVHLGGTCEVYLTPLAERRINVAVLLTTPPAGERSSAAWLAAALREHPRAARHLGDWVTPPQARVLPRARPPRVAERGAFLVGDATGGVDPVLGCGVAIALGTGLEAAGAARRVLAQGSGTPEREYARFVRRETRSRRMLADGLLLLSRHRLLQELVGGGLAAFPALVARLARTVAGGPTGGHENTSTGSAAPDHENPLLRSGAGQPGSG